MVLRPENAFEVAEKKLLRGKRPIQRVDHWTKYRKVKGIASDGEEKTSNVGEPEGARINFALK